MRLPCKRGGGERGKLLDGSILLLLQKLQLLLASIQRILGGREGWMLIARSQYKHHGHPEYY